MKKFLIIVSPVLICLISYLLISGHLGATSFVACFSVILFFIFALFTADRLIEVDFKKQRLVLAEIKTAKEELEVTRAEINALVEDIAFISMSLLSEKVITSTKPEHREFQELQSELKRNASAPGLSKEGARSFARAYQRKKILSRERNRQLAIQKIAGLLKKSGWETQRIAEFSRAAEEVTRENVLSKIRGDIYSLLGDELHKQFDSGMLPRPKGPTLSIKDYAPIYQAYAALSGPNPQSVIKTLFEPGSFWTQELQALISEYENFSAEFPCVKEPVEPLDPEYGY